MRDDVVDWVLDGHEPIWTTATAGELWIAEPASKIGTDEPRVSAALEDYGYGGVDLINKEGQFAYIYASKRRAPASSTAPLLLTGDEHPAAAA